LCAKYPENGPFLLRKGFLFANKGDKQASQKSFQSALACQDLSAMDRSLVQCLLGNPQAAGKLLAEHEQEKKKTDGTYTPEANFHLYQILALQLGGETDRAVEVFRSLITTDAKYAQPGAVKLDIASEIVQTLLLVQQATLEKYPDLKAAPAE
ncbi:MAG: hypothetical protein ACRCXD_11875, partial [Luteolibacter sp.]